MHFENNKFNDNWKNFLIALIPKNTKNKFCPISLASCVLKLIERMINTRLQHYIEKNNLIPESQNGFRRSKSCQHTLAEIQSILTAEALAILLAILLAINHIKNLKKKKKNTTIFLDLLSVLNAIKNYSLIKSKDTSHFILDIITLLNTC